MKEIKYGSQEWERLNDEQNRRDARLKEQEEKQDYSLDDDGKPERCECGARINSHGHCPRCDY